MAKWTHYTKESVRDKQATDAAYDPGVYDPGTYDDAWAGGWTHGAQESTRESGEAWTHGAPASTREGGDNWTHDTPESLRDA